MKMKSILQGLGFASLASLLMTACGPSAGYSTSGTTGEVLVKDDGSYFIVDPNDSGESTTMHLTSVTYGRLIDEVYDVSETTVLHRNLVVRADLVSDSDYEVVQNPISRFTRLTINHAQGTPSYESAFDQLFAGMTPVLTKGIAPTVLPPFTMIPRNAAILVQFSDLLDANSISADTVRLAAGYTPTTPFPVRLLADPNHGAFVGDEFYSTRIILDPVVSALDAQGTGLPVNSVGLPAAVTTGSPNLALRIPTKTDFEAGQFALLQNISGHPVAGLENLVFDFTTSTVDVIRGLRTGGLTEKLGDPNNGFLPDEQAPEVIGRQSITVTKVTNTGTGTYEVDFTFANPLCASAPQIGDVLEQPGVYLEVTAAATVDTGDVVGLETRVLTTTSNAPFLAGGHYETPWGLIDKAPAPCFVEFDPPGVTTASVITNVDPYANIIVRFSEPMDPALMNPYDAFVVSSSDIALEDMGIGSFAVAEVLPSADARDFRFTQVVPYRHTQGLSEDFFINLFEDEGVVDLAGNSLAINFPTVAFTLEPTDVTQRTSGKSFRYQSFFEQENVGKFIDDDKNNLQDIRGQIVWDITRGTMSPRSVDRFSQTIDRNVYVPGWMTGNASTLSGGLLGTAQEPLNPLGCKLMTLWRYFDMGLDVVDEAFVNIDVEHLNWAPIGQNVQAEYFPQFSIAMATSNVLPDESYTVNPNTIRFPNSGLSGTTFDTNLLADPLNTMTVVHDKEEGYFIDPSKKFKSLSGTFMFPYPLNYGKPADEFNYWTFRDTAMTAVGGVDPEVGLEPPVRFDFDPNLVAIGSAEFTFTAADPMATPPIEDVAPNLIAPLGTQIPSFGLPILLEYRCYSSDATVGLNRLDTSLAMGPVWAAAATPQNALTTLPKTPVFRLHSAGGVDSSELIIYKDPDLQTVPSGGFHYEATTIAPKGAQTAAADITFYMGQLDFVVRVSRAHTIWHQVTDVNSTYFQPIIEPSNLNQPKGTAIQVHLRGASTNTNPDGALSDASKLNMYGDIPQGGTDITVFAGPYNQGIGGITDWSDNVDDLQNFRFFQIRLTFINNAAAGTSPELSTLALAFQGQ